MPAEASGNADASPVFFGQVLVEEGLLQTDELARLIRLQMETPPPERRAIGRMAVDHGHLTPERFLSLLHSHGSRLHLGELLVLRGLLSLPDLTRAIREQRESGELLGQVLLRLGFVGPAQLAKGLAEQCGVACMPISSLEVASDLTQWVNGRFARRYGIVPVVRHRRTLTVALWQPRSLAVAADLESSTALSIQVVLTTRREVEERIRQLYGEEDPERTGNQAA